MYCGCFLHDSFGERHQIVEPAGGLHGGERGNDRDDHSQHTRRWSAGRKRKNEYEDRQPDTRNCAECYATQSRTDDDARQQR